MLLALRLVAALKKQLSDYKLEKSKKQTSNIELITLLMTKLILKNSIQTYHK